jgi:hypothetical protein
MKRRAIVVWCDSHQSGGLKGPKADAENIFKYLTSPLGGAWTASEIRCLRNPTRKDVERTVEQFLDDVNHALVYFSGQSEFTRHGKGKGIRLEDGNCPTKVFRSGAHWQTIIIDSNKEHHLHLDCPVLCPNIWNDQKKMNRHDFRNLYDLSLLETGPGINVITGSNHKGGGVDTPQGSVFTLGLLQVAEAFAKGRTHYNVLDFKWAMSRAKTWMKREAVTQQKPTLRNEGRGGYHTLAVKPWINVAPPQEPGYAWEMSIEHWREWMEKRGHGAEAA